MPTTPASRDGSGSLDRAAWSDAIAALDRIEALITELVREAPRSPPAVVTELVERLRRVEPLHAQPLARAIATVVALVAEGRIDPGVALPPLAMACATLADGVRGAFTPREPPRPASGGVHAAAIDASPSISDRELEAARYEIETLLPLPGASPVTEGKESIAGSPRLPDRGNPCGVTAAPDVPLSALRKRTH